MENSNQQAFPAAWDSDEGDYVLGLTKREIFAMSAMQGLLASGFGKINSKWGESVLENARNIAQLSIATADALLHELSKKQTDA